MQPESSRDWCFMWLGWGWRFDVHRNPDCHRLSITVGPLGFRWMW